MIIKGGVCVGVGGNVGWCVFIGVIVGVGSADVITFIIYYGSDMYYSDGWFNDWNDGKPVRSLLGKPFV